MKLESLQLEKFKDSSLKREQMFMLNGGGTRTDPGSGCGTRTSTSQPEAVLKYDYGYDVERKNPDGSIFKTYHNRTNLSIISAAECEKLQGN